MLRSWLEHEVSARARKLGTRRRLRIMMAGIAMWDAQSQVADATPPRAKRSGRRGDFHEDTLLASLALLLGPPSRPWPNSEPACGPDAAHGPVQLVLGTYAWIEVRKTVSALRTVHDTSPGKLIRRKVAAAILPHHPACRPGPQAWAWRPVCYSGWC
jgi:hypothetical protein